MPLRIWKVASIHEVFNVCWEIPAGDSSENRAEVLTRFGWTNGSSGHSARCVAEVDRAIMPWSV